MDKLTINNKVQIKVTTCKPKPLFVFEKGDEKIVISSFTDLPVKIPAGYKLVYQFQLEEKGI